MFFRKLFIALPLALLWLAACSDDDSSGDVVLRIDENGEEFSPTKLEGSVEYLPSMKPEAVRVVRLDNKLYPVDSFELSIESNYMDNYSFRDGLRDYETPYIKVVTVFPSEKKNEKMEFVQYVRLGKDNTKLKQNFFAALAAERIEKLVRDKKYSFAEAEDSAMATLGVVFDMDLNGVNERKYDGLGTYGYYGDLLKDMKPYVYCRHEISDSVFYGDFKKFRETFAEKGTLDSTWIIKAADTWLSTFEILVDSADYLFKSASRDTVDNLVWLDQKFFSRAYGVDLGLTAGAQNVVAIKEKVAEDTLSARGNKATLKADALMASMLRKYGKEEILKLKKANYNIQLEDFVIGAAEKRMLDVIDDAIVPRSGIVFLTPQSKVGRAPFYSSEKILGSWHIKTLWFNMAVMLLMCLVVAGFLFADYPGKLLRKSDQ